MQSWIKRADLKSESRKRTEKLMCPALEAGTRRTKKGRKEENYEEDCNGK
jgi:hypothetical protein